MLEFYHVETDYIYYLKEFQKYIWNNNDGKNQRPYIGVIVNISGHDYFAPLTSPKAKNSNVRDNLMKIRIDHKSDFLGLINLNNMIPVKNTEVNLIDINILEQKYQGLVQTQRIEIRKKQTKIKANAKVLYNKVCNHPDDNEYFVSRCYDFKLLEQKCDEYSKK
ncbi:MAG: type III toxin-antitoxin system ToxN/AbiQ family toxin [Peptostreptococcaceae bacterium]|nr:type III toxin-antitoxin system ToxN/AbiQ family toxin [Peptostreptococcaceae bacterium]